MEEQKGERGQNLDFNLAIPFYKSKPGSVMIPSLWPLSGEDGCSEDRRWRGERGWGQKNIITKKDHP